METEVKNRDVTMGGSSFQLAPEGEALQFHISDVYAGKGQNFETKEDEPRIVVELTLDSEVVGQGQTYRLWFTLSRGPKSNQFKFLKAVFGDGEARSAEDMLGMPLQGILANYEKDGVKRQKVASYLKAAPGQKRVSVNLDEVSADDDFADAELLDTDELFN